MAMVWQCIVSFIKMYRGIKDSLPFNCLNVNELFHPQSKLSKQYIEFHETSCLSFM